MNLRDALVAQAETCSVTGSPFTARLALPFQGSVHVIYHSLSWSYFDRFSRVSAVELLSCRPVPTGVFR